MAPTPNPASERHRRRTVQRPIASYVPTVVQASGLRMQIGWAAWANRRRRQRYLSIGQQRTTATFRCQSRDPHDPVVQQFPRNNDHQWWQINHTVGGNFGDNSSVNVSAFWGWCRKNVRPNYRTCLARYSLCWTDSAQYKPSATEVFWHSGALQIGLLLLLLLVLLIYTNCKLHNNTSAFM